MWEIAERRGSTPHHEPRVSWEWRREQHNAGSFTTRRLCRHTFCFLLGYTEHKEASGGTLCHTRLAPFATLESRVKSQIGGILIRRCKGLGRYKDTHGMESHKLDARTPIESNTGSRQSSQCWRQQCCLQQCWRQHHVAGSTSAHKRESWRRGARPAQVRQAVW
jgi:hypothetical protein